MAHSQARPGQITVRRIPGQREVIGRQRRQVQGHILLVILELMLMRHLGNQPGARQYLHAA